MSNNEFNAFVNGLLLGMVLMGVVSAIYLWLAGAAW